MTQPSDGYMMASVNSSPTRFSEKNGRLFGELRVEVQTVAVKELENAQRFVPYYSTSL